jgi:diguanylate cyclase (GGDEF)-like protein
VTGSSVAERGRGALSVDQHLARSFRALAALVAVALLVAVAAFLVVLGVYQPQLDRLDDAAAGERLAYQGMLDQETGVRGYLLARDTQFLEPYSSGQQELHQGNQQVDDSIGHNSRLAPLLLSTRLSSQAWTAQWAQPLASAAPVPGDPAVLARGKALFDAYRARQAALGSAIAEQLAAARSDRDGTLRAGAVVQAAIFAIVLVLTLRQRRRLRTALVTPLGALLGAMRRARDGDLEARAPEQGPAEIRQMAGGFNEMARTLAEERSVRASRETAVMYEATKLGEVLEMARDLAGSLDLDHVLDAITSHALSVSGYERVCAWLADDERNRLVAARCATGDGSVDMEREPVEVGSGAVGRAAELGRIVAETPGREAPPGARSLTAVPMIVGGRVTGVIELWSTRPYDLPAAAQAVVETLATQAGTAVEAARLHRRTEELTQVDALTRLYNRRRLTADLEAEWKSARRYGRPLSFCMFDVDHFKHYNDARGHRSGDAVLEEVARLVTSAVRGSDSAYRYGGEEFALLLRDTPLDPAIALCERLRARIALRWGHDVDGFTITASFGVAQVDEGMQSSHELVEAADRALYQAKRSGRDRVVAEPVPARPAQS